MSSIALEEYELMKDSKYRVYVSAVDKALKNFDYTSEWADLISALGKLNKVLVSHTKFPVIPRRIKISKRLAQCMHPALPSGVHLKALETYDIIFKCMGTNRLSHELFIYSAGLFPLLGHAAMNVRPSLLTVYETHFVPLGERLRPGLSGFLSGVLPGLEEGSDHFDRTNSLLEKVSDGVGLSHFYGCLWDCLASNSGIRLPAISYVLAHFNKKNAMEEQLYVMGTIKSVMVNALCIGVQDSSVLVQRSALDLLLVCFPMHTTLLEKSDMVRLVTAALTTILRRDMSLNRRLFAWLLGSEVNLTLLNPDHPLALRSKSNESSADIYFDICSREMLIQAIIITLGQSKMIGGQHDLRPYRLLVSLLDKPEIGPIILDDILYEVFRTLYLAADSSDTFSNGGTNPKGSQELLKSANLLFSTLEPCYVWQYIGGLFEKACISFSESKSENQQSKQKVKLVGSGFPGLNEVCTLAEFLLDTVSLETYMDTPSEHLPGLFVNVIRHLEKYCDLLPPNLIASGLHLGAKILSRVQPPILTVTVSSESPVEKNESSNNVSTDRPRAYSDTRAETKKQRKKQKFNKNQEVATNQSESTPQLVSIIYNDRLERFESKQLEVIPRTTSLETVTKNSLSNQNAQSLQSRSDYPIIERCLAEYERFYVKVVGGQRLIPNTNISSLFKQLVIEYPRETEEQRIKKLESLLKACLGAEDSEATKTNKNIEYQDKLASSATLTVNSSKAISNPEWVEVIRIASNLLVELSSFPTFFLTNAESFVLSHPPEFTTFPEWLQVLAVCACWLGHAPDLQLIAIGTLLELISLLRAQCDASPEQDGITPVVMVPLLKPWHVQYIDQHTNIIQVLSHSLWHHFGQLPSSGQVICAELLYQLNNVLPGSEAAENVIGEALTDENTDKRVEAFNRFASLWHLGRELEIKAHSNRPWRSFDKSLLKMLDNLQLTESCPLKLQSQSWLLHSLLRGDISRLVDPLLLMLLDPATARMSVLHVSIEHSNTVLTCLPPELEMNGLNGAPDADSTAEENAAAAKIYAISSVDGNVIYHVSDSNIGENKTKKTRKKLSSFPVRAKRIFAVTTLVGSNSNEFRKHYITEKHSQVKDVEVPTHFAAKSISLFVNPLMGTTGDISETECRLSGKKSSSTGSPDDIHQEIRETKSEPFCIPSSSSSESHEGFDSPPARRWSTDDDDIGELELSTTAEDYFNGADTFSSTSVVEGILNDVVGLVVDQSEQNQSLTKSKSDDSSESDKKWSSRGHGVGVHQLHSHMLLYCGVYDSHLTLYALRTLRNALLTNPRMFLCAAATTGLANMTGTRSAGNLITLLSRHRKSIFGRNFHGDLNVVTGEFSTAYRSSMYLEVLISVCLYFSRSYYPNLGQMRLTSEEIAGNRQVQLASAELLMLICSELIMIVRDSGKGFACYIGDLLSRCKVQKVVLHCVLSSVHNMQMLATYQEYSYMYSPRTFTEEIINFNDPPPEGNESMNKCRFRSSEHSEGFQVQLLRLLLALLMLEHQVNLQKGELDSSNKDTNSTQSGESINHIPGGSISSRPHQQFKYITGSVIPQQPMFLNAIIIALKLDHMRHLHQHWTTLVTSALPFMGQSLTQIVMAVVSELCSNIEKLALFYRTSSSNGLNTQCCLPADYTVTQLEALTVLCHYCLLDTSQQVANAFSQQLISGSINGTIHAGIPGANPGQIFNNLVHVFMPTPLQQESTSSKDKGNIVDPHINARRTVLGNMPRIIASVSALWHSVMNGHEWENKTCILGSPRIVKQQLLEFLSPISLHHGVNFLAAVSVAWQDRQETKFVPPNAPRKVIPIASPDQQVLVYLVSAIRVMPMDTVVQTVHQVVKQPPPIHGAKKELTLEVSVLELFYCYMQSSSGPQLAESWTSLAGLLRDGLTLTPPAQFLMLAILNEFVQKCPPLAEKKDQRDLQDISSKLLESCAQIAGACLEQTTWLRRNLAVREEDPETTHNGKDKDSQGSSISSVSQYSVQAQTVLAELLAPLVDITFGSHEKEKVVTLLTGLLYNITPYLKNHTRRNVPSFHACSHLLASLSSYQYTRKAWRREVFDLLLDPSLFQMESNCLTYWRTIVDNLMTHDNTTFRDLMSRVAIAQTGSLSLFSSREQEYEQRAQLLKRLAFVLLCSETDQYHKYMPEIQERLADSLRLPQVVPAVQAQVFLCFRVLLLRMTPHHVTSLWPIIISEMVQVFLHIEQELSTDSEEFSSHIRLLSALDASWVVNSNNGLHAHGHPQWLQLQLAAAKLLDFAVLMPAHKLPQFQMYRWAFVGDAESTPNNYQIEEESPRSPDFVPHVIRIARLMDNKFHRLIEPAPRPPGQLLLTSSTITSLEELHPFFSVLSAHYCSSTMEDTPCNKAELEMIIERDFLEKFNTRSDVKLSLSSSLFIFFK